MTRIKRLVFQWLCHRQCREATREAIADDREFDYLPKRRGQVPATGRWSGHGK